MVDETTSSSIDYARYTNELELTPLADLIALELSEPYSVYTYRYFLLQWPQHCFLARCQGRTIGGIICKLDDHRGTLRGYIAMLVVEKSFRKQGIASRLVMMAVESMKSQQCQEVVLETEISNHSALAFYQKLGFIRDKRLCRYYLNGSDAFRLKLFLAPPTPAPTTSTASAVPPAATSSASEVEHS
jgi:peptide alpha-N-acetyltransferase